MTTYLSLDVLDQTQHSREGGRGNSYRRPYTVRATVGGPHDADDAWHVPKVDFPFVWIANGRTEIQALRDFLAARKGRAVPFWVPSHQRDLRPVVDVPNGSALVTIARIDYTSQMFAASNGRRHLAMYTTPSAAPIYRKVTASVESAISDTEDLTLQSNVVGDFNKDRCMVSFLRYCRLANDSNDLEWLNNDTVRCGMMFTELPLEAP